jgi:protein tyrosine/serine phosphatase
MTRRIASVFVGLVISLWAANCAARLASAAEPGRAEAVKTARPEKWAAPLSVAGVPNLHKVTDGLYRSAQPTGEGWKNLKALGITTVVNLRSSHSDREAIAPLGIAYEHIPMKAWHAEHQDIARFLKIVSDPKRAPVLVHCEHGADRTGTMCAVYRIVVQGWTKEEALKEMTQGGFGFHETWQNLLHSVEKLDVTKLRAEAGIGD